MSELICAGCGVTFHRPTRRAKYCSEQCGARTRQQAIRDADRDGYNRRRREEYAADADVRRKQRARSKTRKLLPVAQPCSKCGSSPAQRHHRDYDELLDVVWLCARCHRKHHVDAGVTIVVPLRRR